MIWFEIHLGTGTIRKVEVKKYTSVSVWVKRGYEYWKQYKRIGTYEQFYPTFQEAYAAGRKHLKEVIDSLQDELNDEQKYEIRLLNTEVEFLPEPALYNEPLADLQKLILEDE